MLHIRKIALACIAGAALSIMGCQPEQRPDFIPSNAQMTDSGNGKIHYTAPDDGTVYIYDEAGKKLVWSGSVLKGQAVDVDPIRNEIRANGNIVSMKTLYNGNLNDVYFVPAPPMPAPVTPPQTINNYNGVPGSSYNSNSNSNPGNSYNGGLTVTPNVTVQPNNGGQPAGSVTVQPGLNVAPSGSNAPTTQPALAPSLR